MNDRIDPRDRDQLAGRCPFCAAEPPADAVTCPECGRPLHNASYQFRLRRPLWVWVIIYAILALFFGSLLIWLIDLVMHGI